MFLDYSKLEFDKFGRPEKPELLLQTMAEDIIGVIPGVYNLHFNIKFSEPSEMTFDLPATIDGTERNPMYDEVCGYRIIYTKRYGVYLVMNPETESDGIVDVKHVTAYSIEKTLETKRFFLEEGTFKFYNQLNQYDDGTIIGRILEIASGWSVDYISPTVAQRYRTFDQYDDYLLSFVYNSAPEKFRCVFVFEPYEKKISVYDADEERGVLPIYLDFDNLVMSVDLTEQSDDLRTAIRPYGADSLDIRDVNPIGTNWIYDLSYFIENGDIPKELAAKWKSWQRSILNNQDYYKGLVALQASASVKKLTEQAKLTDLQGELDTLIAQQNITIQALAMETTDAGKQYQQSLLSSLKTQITAKESEISKKQVEIDGIDTEITNYGSRIQAVIDQLAIRNYFTDDEYVKLSKYFIEADITEETFVATSVDTTVSGQSYSVASEIVQIRGSAVTRIDLADLYLKTMYTMSGGTFTLSGSHNITGDVIRGTLEVSGNNSFVLSIYAGEITANNTTVASGMITVSGTLSGMSNDIRTVVVDEITTYEGTWINLSCSSGDLYMTANVSDYQRYSVQMELFDYALGVLSDLAVPTYEFSIDSGNFLFEQNFVPYRENLRLGSGVYLNLGDKRVITPLVIEIEFEFEDYSQFSIIFSNRFKRLDQCNTLKDMLEKSYSSSRTIEANKYIYNQAADHASMVSDFMRSAIDAAVNTIKAASNQSVMINGNGINVGGDGPYQIRIVDRMIAMTDDNWDTAKVAIGLVGTPETGTQFVVNAEVVGGKLVIGNNLIIENPTDKGVMQFKVDSSGAWLNNATFVLQKDNGGKIIIDPAYGILAGLSNLFTTEGTTVLPSFIDSRGNIVFDDEGMPENSNFFLDLRDGSAYFRGTVYAKNGTFSGELKAATGTFSGSLVAASGTFKGTVQASRFLDSYGNDMMSKESGKFNAEYLNLKGLNINNRFIVDSEGRVTINEGSISWNAVTGTDEIDKRIEAAQDAANDAYEASTEAESIAKKIANGQYSGTFIDKTSIVSPNITGGHINGAHFHNAHGNACLELGDGGSGYGDLLLLGRNANISGNEWEVFRVTDNIGGASVSIYGAQILSGSKDIYERASVTAHGTWNFSSATVTGVKATFG